MCALLELPPASVPDTLRDGWHGIVGGVLTIFKDLPKAIERSCCFHSLSFCIPFFYVFFSCQTDRKALELLAQEESDDDDIIDEKVLNLTDDEGAFWIFLMSIVS